MRCREDDSSPVTFLVSTPPWRNVHTLVCLWGRCKVPCHPSLSQASVLSKFVFPRPS